MLGRAKTAVMRLAGSPNYGDQLPTFSSAAPCNGTNSAVTSNEDPLLSADVKYTVIGFLKLHVHDMDISDPPPLLPPHPLIAPLGSVNGFLYLFYRRNSQGVTIPPLPSPYQWSFKRPDTPSQPNCNLVRTRLSCRQPPLPVVGGGTTIVYPRLVTDSPDS